MGSSAENPGEHGAAALDSVRVELECEGVVRLADLGGYLLAFAGDGYPRCWVAALQGLLKFPDLPLASHDAALSDRWNLVHLTRLPWRSAVQPVPARE